MRIEGIVADLDGTLYPFPENKNDIFSNAVARAACNLGFEGGYEKARALASSSWQKYGSEIAVFVEEFGMDQAAIFIEAHDIGSAEMIKHVQPLRSIFDTFNRMSQHDRVAILTHASHIWAMRFVQHLGLGDIIAERNVLALDHPKINFVTKDRGPETFDIAAKAIDVDPRNIVVFEDSIGNLEHAADLGMHTVYVHWGKPKDTLPPYVRSQVATPCKFIIK